MCKSDDTLSMNLPRVVSHLFVYILFIYDKNIVWSKFNAGPGPTVAINSFNPVLPRTHEIANVGHYQDTLKQGQANESREPSFRLVTIDINNRRSDDRVQYSFDADTDTHFFTANGINFIKRVQNGDNVLWDSGNRDFAKEVSVKYNKLGEATVRIHSYGEESPLDIMRRLREVEAKSREEKLKAAQELMSRERELKGNTELKSIKPVEKDLNLRYKVEEDLVPGTSKMSSEHLGPSTEMLDSITSDEATNRLLWKPRHVDQFGKPLVIPDSMGRTSVTAIFPQPKEKFAVEEIKAVVKEPEALAEPTELKEKELKPPVENLYKGQELVNEAKTVLRKGWFPDHKKKLKEQIKEPAKEELVKELETVKEPEVLVKKPEDHIKELKHLKDLEHFKELESAKELEPEKEQVVVEEPKPVVAQPKRKVIPVIVPKKKEPIDIDKLVGIPLNISNEYSTDKYDYNKNDCGDTIFAAKKGYGFNVVKDGNSTVWKAREKSKYADFVDIYQTGWTSRDLTVFMVDRTVERYRRGPVSFGFSRQYDKKEFAKYLKDPKKYQDVAQILNQRGCSVIICRLSFGLLMCC